MNINLSHVDYNPYRDLDIDPITPDRVASLAASIEGAAGFWGGITVREVDDRYQLAFGHHRLEALKSLGWTEADFTVADLTDAQMVQAMFRENALQRKGLMNTAESVKAAMLILGPAILTGEIDGKILPSISKASIGQAQRKFRGRRRTLRPTWRCTKRTGTSCHLSHGSR